MTTSTSVTLPRGESASFEEMQAYGETLQRFICAQEALLPAMTDVQCHNETIDFLRMLADAYNEQLRIFKDRQAQQQVVLVGLIHLPNG